MRISSTLSDRSSIVSEESRSNTVNKISTSPCKGRTDKIVESICHRKGDTSHSSFHPSMHALKNIIINTYKPLTGHLSPDTVNGLVYPPMVSPRENIKLSLFDAILFVSNLKSQTPCVIIVIVSRIQKRNALSHKSHGKGSFSQQSPL